MKREVKDILLQAKSIGWIMEHKAREIFIQYGLPVSKYTYAETLDEALLGAKNVKYPLVAKIVSPDVIHKSDVGGVIVGIKNDNELKDAFDRLKQIKGFNGVLLDSMQKGVEMIVGSNRDPQFGHVVLVGIGGTSVEIYKDVAIRMAPVTKNEAIKAIESLKGISLLKGYRGTKPANIVKLALLIEKFSKMLIDLDNTIQSIDCNPVMVNSSKAIIADARIMV